MSWMREVTRRGEGPSRRAVVGGLAAGTAALGLGGAALMPRLGREQAVIIGGGPAGAAAAIAWRQHWPDASVLLIERDPTRLGLLVQGAQLSPVPMGPDLSALRRAEVEVAVDEAVGLDWSRGRLALMSGRDVAFDRLVVAPGTAPVAEAIPGRDARARHHWPAAWGSAREARRLEAQLHGLPEAGHVVLRLPAQISHQQAAVARALFLAQWLQDHRPAGRLTVLDGTADDRLRTAFDAQVAGTAEAGQDLRTRVDWLGARRGGVVTGIDTAAGTLETPSGRLHADVVNFVSPQAAGQVAALAGLTDASGWCPVDAAGRSTQRTRTLVLGDARKGVMRTAEQALTSAHKGVSALS